MATTTTGNRLPSGIAPYPTSTGFTSPTNIPFVGAHGMAPPTSTDIASRMTGLMGGLGGAFPSDLIRLADIPFIEAGINYQLMQQSEADRQRGFEELVRGREAIGTSPESQMAREIAMRRAQENPFEQEISQQRATLRGQMANQGELAQQAMAEEMARRGIGGGVPARAMAQLEADAMREAAAAQSEFEMQSAMAVEEAQRQAYQDLMQLALQQEAERMAIDQAIANVFLETERAPIDLSGLLQPVPGGGLLAGYPYEGFYLTQATETPNIYQNYGGDLYTYNQAGNYAPYTTPEQQAAAALIPPVDTRAQTQWGTTSPLKTRLSAYQRMA